MKKTLIEEAFSPIPEPVAAPVAPVVKEQKKKTLDPFTALMAQEAYKAPIDARMGGMPQKGGTAEAMGTGGAWGKPG